MKGDSRKLSFNIIIYFCLILIGVLIGTELDLTGRLPVGIEYLFAGLLIGISLQLL